ncbi:MAG: Rossmann fold nucleotide-binding protein [Salinirussus sp.]
MRVSVIGASQPSETGRDDAFAVGQELGERGHDLVCGGLGGVMESACRGATEAGAHTVGILPGTDRMAANPYVQTAITTGMGSARNVLVVMNGVAVVAIEGAAGTLSELGHALDIGRPIAGLNTHAIELDGIEAVATPVEAVDHIEGAIDRREC